MICREKMEINYIKMKCTNIHNYAATIPGEASHLYACLEAGRTSIPECKPVGRSKPGWNAEVKELREDSLF